ncbi:hypothetical protein AX15_007838 [Amanita polypyramis BW_CC]|nr:hypothetical protein AX15_007838 [Amanita polypyramis BW_CC]
MLDDEVEYIGSRVAKRTPSVSDPLILQRPITGLTLHVEKSGAAAAYALIFHKTHSSVVQIGRRPGTENDEYYPGKAMFRCPVVSRRHAKIAFSDAGSVYLYDLGSHHGTHVRKPDEAFSRMLKPETPCLLNGGEFVTLGKSVGKGDDLVRPVVFRVEIHHAQSSSSTKLIDLTRSASAERQHSVPIKVVLPKSSGRYGLNDTSSSSSSDEMSSSYMNDITSDVEEIIELPLLDRARSSSHFGHAIEVLKNLIPPVHPPASPQRSRSPSDEQSPLLVFPPMHLPAWDSYSHRPRLPFSPPFDLPPLTSDKVPEIPDWNKLYEDSPYERVVDKSGSDSPMDLASPSPDPPSFRHMSTAEPKIVGAWPNSPRASSVRSNSSLYAECGTMGFVDEASNVSVRMLSEERMKSVPVPVPVGELSTENHDGPAPDVSTVHETDLTYLRMSVDLVKVDLSNLQSCQDEIKTRIATEVGRLADKVANSEERYKDLNFGLGRAESSSELNATHIQGLQSALSSLQHEFKSFVESNNAQSREQEESLSDRQDVKENVETSRKLVSEMKTLLDNTQQQMAAELDIVKAARLTTLTRIHETMSSSTQNQNPGTGSLKRKRDDEGETGEGQNEHDETASNKSARRDCSAADDTIGPNGDEVVIPKPKRARRVASTIFRTATAVTLGAVATWSALAYS